MTETAIPENPHRKELLDRAMAFYDRLFDLTRTVVTLNLAVGVLSSFLFGTNTLDNWPDFVRVIIFLAVLFFGVVFNLGAWCVHSFLYLTVRRILREVRKSEPDDESSPIPRFTRLIDADSLYREPFWETKPRLTELRARGVGRFQASLCVLVYAISNSIQDKERASDEAIQLLYDHAFLFEKVFFLVCVLIWILVALGVLLA